MAELIFNKEEEFWWMKAHLLCSRCRRRLFRKIGCKQQQPLHQRNGYRAYYLHYLAAWDRRRCR